MGGDRFLFTAFAIGYMGPRRAAKYILAGVAIGLLFWVVMGALIASSDKPVVFGKPALTNEQIIRQWPADQQNKTYLRSIGFCCDRCEQVPQCNN